MKTMWFVLTLLLSLSAMSATKTQTRKSDDDLTQAEATQRRQQVESVKYDLAIALDKGKEGYTGSVTIDLVLKDLTQDLSIDNMMDKILKITVNGAELKTYTKRKGSFDLPKKVLATNTQIQITFSNKYSKEAAGFQSVIDPEDKSEYVYTDFEPYQAHKFFPCLDQPDLKARLKVSVTAPKDWKAISNELIDSTKEDGNFTTTTFKETQPISTYLFFVGAGPFVLFEDKFENTPLHLYARQSLAKYVDEENIFATTKKGLKFFNEYFGYAYPFSKYGQILIPEFAWGGMENPGMVTLNERIVFRGPVPESRRSDRDDLILHEMAHHWFGDLVTMDWWGDLWLNESFATYAASLAQESAMKQKLTWLDFFTTKAWGYWQDQLVTTHPIETPVPDVRTARGNFDGITYAKGASALKQLHFYVGDEGFREGLRYYFKNYAWKNTKRSDFIGAIALKSKVNLDEWTKTWLQTAGPNAVEVQYACERDKISKVEVIQTPSVSGTLSTHRMKIGLYELDEDELDHEETIDVVYSGAVTPVKELTGEDCPDFIMPNVEDKDYALFSLDQKSLSNASIALTGIESPLNRLMLWNILSEMLRNQKLSAVAYFDLVQYGLGKETDDGVLGFILGRHGVIKDQYQLYLTKEQRAEMAPKFETIVWKKIASSKEGSSLQMTFFDFFTAMAQTTDSQSKLYEMLTKNTPPKGIVLDQDRRWAIIQNLSINGHPKALELTSEEVKKDPSTNGKKMDIVARAAFPDLKMKQSMWKEIFTNKDMSYSQKKEAGSKLHLPNRPDLSEPFVEEYFKKVLSFDWASHDDIVDVYFEQLFPARLCSQKVADLSAKKFKVAKNMTNLSRRAWIEAQDELERCVKVRNTVNSAKF